LQRLDCFADARNDDTQARDEDLRTAMFLIGFPLLLIPFVIYNMIAFLTPGVGWTTPVATVHMMSGQDWVLTWEDLLLAFAILLLAVEMIKSTRMGMRSIVDHILAMALFIAMLVEFLLVQQAGTSTFFLLTMIGLVDVLVGFIVSIRSSQRQIEVQTERTA
jgi:hypothetical protein